MDLKKWILKELKMEIAKLLTGMTEEDVLNLVKAVVNLGYMNLSQFDKQMEEYLNKLITISLPFISEFLYALLLQIAKENGIVK